MPEAFDFDAIDEWGPTLRIDLDDLLPPDIDSIIAGACPTFAEDARDVLLCHVERDELCRRLREWISARPVCGYHGTRVTAPEVETIRRDGLLPLDPLTREVRLRRALSGHPRWTEVEPRLMETIEMFGSGNLGGKRQGQVHLTLSGHALTRSFNHYLTHGAEFDQKVACDLLGAEGYALLAGDGVSVVVKLAVPGDQAFQACNRYWSPGVNDPNLVREMIVAWSRWLGDPCKKSADLQPDCGLVFKQPVPASWIISCTPVDVPVTDRPRCRKPPSQSPVRP